MENHGSGIVGGKTSRTLHAISHFKPPSRVTPHNSWQDVEKVRQLRCRCSNPSTYSSVRLGILAASGLAGRAFLNILSSSLRNLGCSKIPTFFKNLLGFNCETLDEGGEHNYDEHSSYPRFQSLPCSHWQERVSIFLPSSPQGVGGKPSE